MPAVQAPWSEPDCPDRKSWFDACEAGKCPYSYRGRQGSMPSEFGPRPPAPPPNSRWGTHWPWPSWTPADSERRISRARIQVGRSVVDCSLACATSCAVGQRCLPCRVDATLPETVLEVSAKRIGMTAVLNHDGGIAGVFTDGDLRRALVQGIDFNSARVGGPDDGQSRTYRAEH